MSEKTSGEILKSIISCRITYTHLSLKKPGPRVPITLNVKSVATVAGQDSGHAVFEVTFDMEAIDAEPATGLLCTMCYIVVVIYQTTGEVSDEQLGGFHPTVINDACNNLRVFIEHDTHLAALPPLLLDVFSEEAMREAMAREVS